MLFITFILIVMFFVAVCIIIDEKKREKIAEKANQFLDQLQSESVLDNPSTDEDQKIFDEAKEKADLNMEMEKLRSLQGSEGDNQTLRFFSNWVSRVRTAHKSEKNYLAMELRDSGRMFYSFNSFLKYCHNEFDRIEWEDSDYAVQLIRTGEYLIGEGCNSEGLYAIVKTLINLLPSIRKDIHDLQPNIELPTSAVDIKQLVWNNSPCYFFDMGEDWKDFGRLSGLSDDGEENNEPIIALPVTHHKNLIVNPSTGETDNLHPPYQFQEPYDYSHIVKKHIAQYKEALNCLKQGNVPDKLWYHEILFPAPYELVSLSECLDWGTEEYYMRCPMLKEHLEEVVSVLLDFSGEFERIDAGWVHISMTLFDHFFPNGPYEQVLNKYFNGEPHAGTMRYINDNTDNQNK